MGGGPVQIHAPPLPLRVFFGQQRQEVGTSPMYASRSAKASFFASAMT